MTDTPSDQPSDQSHDQAHDQVREPGEEPTPSSGPPPLSETIRAKLEEYDVERHLEELAATVESAVRQGVEMVGALAHDHRADIEGFLSRTAEALDRRTEGKHAATIASVRGQLERGVERIAEHRPVDTDTTDTTDTTEPPAGGPDDGTV